MASPFNQPKFPIWTLLGYAPSDNFPHVSQSLLGIPLSPLNFRRNCVEVWPYLTDVLRRLPGIASTDTAALEALLPDRWVAAHPEHRLEQREEESREAQVRRRRKRAARRAVVAP